MIQLSGICYEQKLTPFVRSKTTITVQDNFIVLLKLIIKLQYAHLL